ncbi:hypothetical protein ACFLWR_07265 [Chloroflexota bacterium]
MSPGQSIGRAKNGSQKYIQDLVNYSPEYLNRLIFSNNASLMNYSNGKIEWVSPLDQENFKEYRDDRFLWPIRQAWYYKQLGKFWPSSGPQWDALAIVYGADGSEGVILVEAKANTLELGGPQYACQAKSQNSIDMIQASFTTVKNAIGTGIESDWLGDYYQYANRIAHLYFLREICKVPTWLVYLYFVNGWVNQDPSIAKHWKESIATIYMQLGLPENHLLSDKMINIFPNINSDKRE